MLFAWLPTTVLQEPASCLPDHCFCEAIRTSGIAQPANTWSCLGFVWLGLFVLWLAFEDARNKKIAADSSPLHPGYSVLYGAALILTGVGSAALHATLSLAGQFTDVFGMYLIGTFIVLQGISRLSRLSPKIAIFSYLFSNTLLAILLWFFPPARRYAFALLVIVAIVIQIRAQNRERPGSSRYFWLAAAALALGFVFWILDITKVLCSPHSWLQGHAVWHLLSAVASGLVYLHFRSAASRAV
jgi:dihydroceramidase